MTYSKEQVHTLVTLYANLQWKYAQLVSDVGYFLARNVSTNPSARDFRKSQAVTILSAIGTFHENAVPDLATLVEAEVKEIERFAKGYRDVVMETSAVGTSTYVKEGSIEKDVQTFAASYANLLVEYMRLRTTDSSRRNGSVHTTRAINTLMAFQELINMVPPYLLLVVEQELAEMYKEVRRVLPEKITEPQKKVDSEKMIALIEMHPSWRLISIPTSNAP